MPSCSSSPISFVLCTTRAKDVSWSELRCLMLASLQSRSRVGTSCMYTFAGRLEYRRASHCAFSLAYADSSAQASPNMGLPSGGKRILANSSVSGAPAAVALSQRIISSSITPLFFGTGTLAPLPSSCGCPGTPSTMSPSLLLLGTTL
ncbi:hypothetical protein CALCODRAFT_491271 [Calocera cornea HHB12733]|uniref:Uncharacterized protein n=1 Tax=Calocera cornea HHB12733 TaxID=1353952 RepID=A0A165J734_9BASI|nr:hypothetical protein CALCODRAFT_491271 [Calocera cornea HHB12733]